jgi:hypothetical protein
MAGLPESKFGEPGSFLAVQVAEFNKKSKQLELLA